MTRLSAACPRTPTRPRTPRTQARYTLAPPAPRLVDGMLYGGRHGGRAGAIGSTDDHVDALARKRCEQAVRRAILFSTVCHPPAIPDGTVRTLTLADPATAPPPRAPLASPDRRT